MLVGQRSTSDRADGRARGVELGLQGGLDPSYMWSITALRNRSAWRTRLARECRSCGGPIDAMTGECRCSA